MRRLWLLLSVFDDHARRLFVLAVVGSIILGLLDSLGVALVLPLMDVATGQMPTGLGRTLTDLFSLRTPAEALPVLTAIVVGLFIVKGLASLAFSWWSAGFTTLQRVYTSTRLMRHFLTMPYTRASQRSSSELVRTMTDAVGVVFGSGVSGLMQAVTNGFSILWIVVALLWVAPVPTLVLCAYFSLAALAYNLASKNSSHRFGATMAKQSLEAWKWALGAFGGLKEIHLRGAQGVFVKNYEDASIRAARAQRAGAFVSAIPRYMLEIMFIVAIGLVLLLGARGASTSAIGLLAVFVAAGFRVMPSVTGLLAALSSVRVGQASLELVADEFHQMALEPAITIPTNEAYRLELTRELTLRDVSFRYPGSGETVLDSVTLTIPRGTSIGIVGASGAGKTTLVDLILGFHAPLTGRIEADGHDVFRDLAAWRRSLGYVPQDVFILDASLAENVGFEIPTERMDENLLRACVAKAQLTELVGEHGENLHLALGERGSRLSGGQRQRVGIARALYRQPSVLVLDEATSALDNKTENEFTRAIDSLRGELTTIVVAHRLSTVRHLDQVAFLKDGILAGVGSFDDLMATNSDFAELVALGGGQGLTDDT